MPQIAKFHAGLRELEEKMLAVEALTDRAAPPPDADLGAARWAVARTLAEVASFKEKFLLAPLEAGGDEAMAANGKMIANSMHTGLETLIAHSNRWSADAVLADWSGFRRALAEAYQLIRDHFAMEAAIVPSMLATLEGASSAPTRNWTRPIWAIHDAMHKE